MTKEVRNPKAEIRRKSEIRTADEYFDIFADSVFKCEMAFNFPHFALIGNCVSLPHSFGLRNSDYFRHSSFGIRHSFCRSAFGFPTGFGIRNSEFIWAFPEAPKVFRSLLPGRRPSVVQPPVRARVPRTVW